jgi:hypothetical protein
MLEKESTKPLEPAKPENMRDPQFVANQHRQICRELKETRAAVARLPRDMMADDLARLGEQIDRYLEKHDQPELALPPPPATPKPEEPQGAQERRPTQEPAKQTRLDDGPPLSGRAGRRR